VILPSRQPRAGYRRALRRTDLVIGGANPDRPVCAKLRQSCDASRPL